MSPVEIERKADLMTFLKARLDSELLAHSLGTADTAVELARRHSYNLAAAELAGLLHDCARALSPAELLRRAEEYQLCISDMEREQPALLHGPVGAVMAQRELEVEDEEILDAISNHTTGHPRLRQIGKLVFVADFIEPTRDFAGIQPLRGAIFRGSLDEAVRLVLQSKISYLIQKRLKVVPRAIDFWNSMVDVKNY